MLLRGGGHIAELRLASSTGPAVNCLWVAPWPIADPGTPEYSKLAEKYGADAVGACLAGFTGHSLCLDTFGMPTTVEAALGVPLHGEASVRNWGIEVTDNGCICRASLPVARLAFQREILLVAKSAALFVSERVESRDESAREIHWVQHVSLGPPFLLPSQSSVHASLDRVMTWPDGYEGHEILRGNAAFDWPHAPMLDGVSLNLETPFWRRGFGYVAAARVSVDNSIGWIAALNWQLGIALIYCFRREDFPWVAVWEENSARTSAPWNSVTQVRGMEFGTTPMPIGRERVRKLGDLFGTPGSRVLASGAAINARYAVCIARVPESWRAVADVVPAERAFKVVGPDGKVVSIAAEGLGEFLKGKTQI